MDSDEYFMRSIPCAFSYSFRDLNDNPFPSHILQAFQDVASRQVDDMGLGYEDLLKSNLIWALIKVRFRFVGKIQKEEAVVTTWPHKQGVLRFDRDYSISNPSGEEAVIGSSEWAVLDINTRRLVRPPFTYPADKKLFPRVTIPEGYFSLNGFPTEKMEPVITHQIVFTDLDHNKHANNTGYASLAIDSIPNIENFRVKEMQINFLEEVRFHDQVSTYCLAKGENTYEVLGIRADGIRSFDSLIILEHI